MKLTIQLSIVLATIGVCYAYASGINSSDGFDMEHDLLLAQFDCKTDVDDLHTVAGLRTLLANPDFARLQYHAVAGSYGIQDGLYVPANELFELAFDHNWSDAHLNFDLAVEEVTAIVKTTLQNNGDVWIAEGGQSDFSAAVVRTIQAELPEINTARRIHIIQHGKWNEKVTSPENLAFVKQNTDYLKIPDGNASGNGTPDFRFDDFKDWKRKMTDPALIAVWQLAIDIGNKYNGKEGRYNNETIAAGGLDFSDLVEICWILDLPEMENSEDFFNLYSK